VPQGHQQLFIHQNTKQSLCCLNLTTDFENSSSEKPSYGKLSHEEKIEFLKQSLVGANGEVTLLKSRLTNATEKAQAIQAHFFKLHERD